MDRTYNISKAVSQGTTVVANPAEEATEELTKLKVADKVYGIPQGKLDANKNAVATVGGLVTPSVTLANNELVGVDVNGEQIRVRLGEGLTLERSGSSIGEGGGDGGGGGDAGGGIGGKRITSIYTLKSSGGGGGGKQLYEHKIVFLVTHGENYYTCVSQPIITDSNKQIEMSDFNNYSDRLTFILCTPLIINSKTKAFMVSTSVGTNLLEFTGVKTDSTGLNVVFDDIEIIPNQGDIISEYNDLVTAL